MANLIIQENGVARTRPAVTGEEITIQTPCGCSDVTGVQINGVAFPFYDATGHSLADVDSLFDKDSLIRVLIDADNIRAYILNADTNAYLERRLARTFVAYDMLVASWSGNTYSFEQDYPHAEYDISIEVAPTATPEQFEAFGKAKICGSIDSNIATALGDVPTEDIPIIVRVVKK